MPDIDVEDQELEAAPEPGDASHEHPDSVGVPPPRPETPPQQRRANFVKALGQKMGVAPKGVPAAPASNLEISMLARRRVRGMLKVISTIAQDPTAPKSVRVTAAKAMIDFAKVNQEELSKLSPAKLETLVNRIIALRNKGVENPRKYAKLNFGPPSPDDTSAETEPFVDAPEDLD